MSITLLSRPQFRIAGIALTLTVAGVATMSAAKPGSCSDVPIALTFVATTAAPAAITNDSAAIAYQDGSSGVDAVIHYNMACDGTRDATMNLYNARRTLTMQFPTAVDGSTAIQAGPAPFAGGAPLSVKPFLNIRNLIGYGVLPPNVAATYYTRAVFHFADPSRQSWSLLSFPDDASCPGICSPTKVGSNPYENQPEQTAWAKVTYTPRNLSQPWSSSNTDSWIVEVETPTGSDTVLGRSTLYLEGKNQSLAAHYGQYSMPFKVLITALAPLP